MIVFGYVAALLMGLVLGLIGGGGSIMTVPILVYLMGLDPEIATGYSLLIVGVCAAFGAFRYYQKGMIDISASLVFAIPSVLGVYFSRGYLLPSIPDVFTVFSLVVTKQTLLMVLFAALMLLSSTLMLRSAFSNYSPTATNDSNKAQCRVFILSLEGAVVGVVTGLLGAGGGFLIVPVLTLMLGMPMSRAVAASLFIIALKSLVGFAGDIQAGIPIAMPLVPAMLTVTLIGMSLSGALSQRISETLLKQLFAFFTLGVGFFILYKELF